MPKNKKTAGSDTTSEMSEITSEDFSIDEIYQNSNKFENNYKNEVVKKDAVSKAKRKAQDKENVSINSIIDIERSQHSTEHTNLKTSQERNNFLKKLADEGMSARDTKNKKMINIFGVANPLKDKNRPKGRGIG